MKRADLVKSLKEWTGGKPWISKHMLKAWLGVGDVKLEEFTQSLDKRFNGNRIEFYIGDVAEKVMDQCIKGIGGW